MEQALQKLTGGKGPKARSMDFLIDRFPEIGGSRRRQRDPRRK